jgi:hypothetical protein
LTGRCSSAILFFSTTGGGEFLKNYISKVFRAQPFEIPRNAQGNVFENLEASKNISIFSMKGKAGNLRIRCFLAQNKEIPNIYLAVREARGRPPLTPSAASYSVLEGWSPEPTRS